MPIHPSPSLQSGIAPLRMQGVRALLFDLDGTLVDTEQLHYESTACVLAQHGIELQSEEFDRHIGWEEHSLWVCLKQRFDLPGEPEVWAAQSIETYIAVVQDTKLTPLPGVEAMLAWGSSRGLPMAVVSSLPHDQIDATLRAAELSYRLPVRFSGHDDVRPGRGKPAPDVYLAAAAALGVKPAACLAFEDSPIGMKSAQDANCLVVAIPRKSRPPCDLTAAGWVCSSFHQALNLLHESQS